MNNHKFVFIGGLHRSGKTLLYNCLKEHPMLSGFRANTVYQDEGQHAQTVYKQAKFYGGPGKFGFNPEAHLTETSPLATEENRIKLFSEWKRYWDMGKPYLLEQSPPNLIRTRFLQNLFPHSYFIIIMRHPIPVSFETRKTMQGNKATIYSLIKHWIVVHEIFNKDSEHIKRLYVLKYEEFVNDPGKYLNEIYVFLGLNEHAGSVTVHPDANLAYFERWRKCQKNILKKLYMKLLYCKFEIEVNRFGYSLKNLHATFSNNYLKAITCND